jgi:hypothetical protein
MVLPLGFTLNQHFNIQVLGGNKLILLGLMLDNAIP